ncbi:MAG: hypothetical protein JOY80_05085 [Candidatus Dormibacteraeota bacterium]|nr:hypothetical protein [Candidatus Dormibacteraeota bacterium]
MSAQEPGVGDVLLAIVFAVVGCLAGAYAAYSGWRTGNWFAWLCALGCAAFVVGIAAQRSFPSEAAVQALGNTAAASSRPGPWDAGVSLPVIGVRITPVTLGGLLVAAFSVSLLLLFEHVPDPARVRVPRRSGLEEDDAV